MNETGPLARPLRETGSREERIGDGLIPAPPPCGKIGPSWVFQSSSSGIESSALRMKQAEVRGRSVSPALSHTGVANVARCCERGPLGEHQRGQLVAQRVALSSAADVTYIMRPGGDRSDRALNRRAGPSAPAVPSSRAK